MRHEAESLHGLLARLAELNIKIGLDGEQLRVDAPTGVLDEDVKQALRHHKNNLVIDLKKARGGQAPSQWPQVQVDPDSRYEPFPLTDIQWAYWLGRNNGIELGNVATHFYFEVDSQELDIDRFQQAFRLLIARHDMLRGIVDNDGQQRILSVVPEYHITVEDLSTASAELQDTHLSRIRTQMSHQVRETDQWPLFDVRAARLGQKTRLFFSWDFLNLDAWSLFLMFREWRVLYDNIDQSLPTISISYRDYVLTERLLKKSDGYGLAHDYWWARIDHMPGAPILPVKAKIASDRQHRFVRRRGRITRALWQSLRRRGQARGLTPSGILLAAFAEVLTLWSKRPHFCLNLTLFNRLPLHKDVECLIGDFTSILLLEVNNQQVEAFYERAARIQKQFMKDLQHREISGVEVLREWSKRQGNALQAVMPVVFTSALALGSGEESDAGVLESFGPMVYGISQTPQVYLDVQVMEDSQGVFFNWDAVEEVFEPGVLDAMFTSYCQLLEQLTDSKLLWEQRHVLTLPAGQARQRQAVNATAVDLSDELLHGLFIQQALQQPKSVAIVSAEHQITYGELLAMSHSLSQQLLDRGVSPNTLVAVVMEKGWEQIVAVLGILIAGAAYLPIDPALPTTRRQQYFEQSQARLAITQQALQPVLEWPGHIDCLVVSRDLSLNWLEQAPRPRQTITDLAYVIFTSGSTGVPKGVMINHRGAVNTILHVNRLFEINAQDKVLAVSSLSFDLSVYDIFGLLATGGTIVMPEPQRVHHPEHWQALINKYGITVWNSAPPLMGMLTDHLEGEKYENIRSLRLALLSGDWVPVSLPDRVKQHCPNTRVISLGGATEASIWSIYYPIGEVAPHWQSIPYGKPLPNQRVYVLNSALQHCPQGVIGHIYIGGVGLAQGYWNDRERTAKQFFEHPDRHEVLYDTGDLGRYLSDGNIEFLGREDFQVKLNGHRVELGEISSQLQGHPDIAEAVVKVCKHGQDQQQLTAYIVPDKTLDNPLYQWQTAPEQVLNPLWEELESAADRQLERSVKNQTRRLQIFAQFWDKVEQISLVAMIETLRSLSNEMLPLEQLENALADQGVKPQNFTLVKQWVELLKNKKVIDTSQGYIEFRESAALPQRALSQLLEELKKFTTWDETANDFYEYIENCITQQINLLKGQVAPLDLLFPKGSWRVAESIYQHNPIAQHHNSVMGEITKSIVEAENRKNKIRILEVGAGTGAATESLLRELPAEKVEYVYTDLSSYFTTLAKQKFKDYPFIRYARYDIDKGPLAQGYQSHSFDMVVAVNVLHDAKNIEAALKKLRCLLVPGGLLLLLEGTQNTAFQMVTVAFLEGFGHFRDERLNDNLPLLNTSQWKHKLVDCGFEKVAVFPKKSPLLDAFEQHVILARGPEEVKIFQGENRLKEYLKSRLPTYMVPKKIVEMDFLPVNTNGKIDLNSLPGVEINTLDEKQVFAAPHSDYEKKIAAIWCEILQIKSVGIHHNFFDVGADSLLLIQTKNRINEAFKVKVTSTDLLQYTTISELARYLKSIVDPSEINKTSDTSANNQRALKQKEAIVRQHRMIEKRRQNV